MKMKRTFKMKNNCASMGHIGNFDRKAQAALALAVSLWIAGGGVAGANASYELYLNDADTPTFTGTLPPGVTAEKRFDSSGKPYFYVSCGEWNTDTALWYICGGYESSGSGYTLQVENFVKTNDSYLKLYGAYRGNSENGNTVYVKNSTVGATYGRYSNNGSGPASNNTVIGENSIFTSFISGGEALGNNADNNKVMLTGGEVQDAIYGGYSESMNNVSDLSASDNTVILRNVKVNTDIYGGEADSSGAKANGNSVRLQDCVFGPRRLDNPRLLPLYPSGLSPDLYLTGARSMMLGKAEYNTLVLQGTIKEGVPTLRFSENVNLKNYDVSASSTNNADSNNNALSLVGAMGVDGSDGGKVRLFGAFKVGTGSQSGNELHLGGVKTYTKSGDSYTPVITDGEVFAAYAKNDSGAWVQTNTVKSVENFDSIVLHNVKWSETIPVLAAKSFEYNESVISTPRSYDLTNTTLDIRDMNISGPGCGTMTLLQSGTENNFNNLKLKYSDADAAAISGSVQLKTETGASSAANGVTLACDTVHSISLADVGRKVNYNIKGTVKKISFGEMEWGKARDAGDSTYNYAGVTNGALVNVDGLSFKNPQAVTGTTTLLKANDTLTAALSDVEKSVDYTNASIASGVTMDGVILGSVKHNGNNIEYTATANNASKLTFGNVEWKDSGMLIDHNTELTNVSFNGAAVDTSNINFTNIKELEANKEMTLVGGFGDTVGTITGTKYMVGSTLQGEGKASLEGSNLVFRTDTTAGKIEVQEQTHNTVMSEEVGMDTIDIGDDFILAAEDGLGHTANVGADGIASFATMGGGAMRQETGSHVDARTWNAIIALGHKNDKEKCSFEYGAFFEYGRGNYTTHNGDQRGDGSTYYAGGGLLAKWQKKDGIYVEGSLRAGNVHDDAKNVLRDAMGNPYSYETDAPYWGVHVGVGKVITLNESSELDVYGKFFHNHRNSVSFDAGGHYDLDAVNSDVLRLGTRYVMKREKWNFYGGLAYEQEFSGKAEGTADGMAIRGADTSGGSLRAELGAVLNPKKDGPITLDFNLSGFAGKKRGLTGGVAVTFNF
ncbi:autotransporter outer membrane beta-barrel domain-containing protein [Schwartzia succinivorans]|jgi:hypothetical protein|uniref:Autotransporter domain-containing protein n=1 Tax=Schwartzia succinivorans DSM 10502 TaxID=1123243 RepID=A0A1M4T4D4_9FIRM|nr:autotransporter outer membrane beta-barrel domain-containing protein [Schwartzia succinivorans]SHE39187.1 hypothetical protein SAMN02745190_00358 [Schwartzia succinivorans DSM 10502]